MNAMIVLDAADEVQEYLMGGCGETVRTVRTVRAAKEFMEAARKMLVEMSKAGEQEEVGPMI
jgi:hypothetical protein